MNIFQKLIEVRKEVPYLQKDTKGYKYSYVSGSTVLGKIKAKMDALGLLLIPSIVDFEACTMPIREKEKVIDKPTVKCKMIMTWVDSEKPSEKIEVPFACFGTQDDISKAFGSALTYSERYFILKFFNIATDSDDPDAYQGKQEKSVKKQISKEDEFIQEQESINNLSDYAQSIIRGMDECETLESLKSYIELVPKGNLSSSDKQYLNKYNEKRKDELS